MEARQADNASSDELISRWQRLALVAVEVLGSSTETIARWRSRFGMFPVGSLLRGCVELLFLRKFPRASRALLFLRYAARNGLPSVFSSSLVSKLIEHQLGTRPQRALVALGRLESLVRVTRPLHRTYWSLPMARTELGSLTVDASRSDLLNRADFEGATLTEVRLFGSLYRARFAGATLDRVSFIGCYLGWASFRGAKLEDVVLASGQVTNCRFDGATISHCTFSDLDFEGSSFDAATFEEVVFERCDLDGVDFEGAIWANADFVDCRNLSDGLGDEEAVNVTVGKGNGARNAGRAALGAAPRNMARDPESTNLPRFVSVRYANAGTQSSPPLGYRLQTLTRDLTLWAALGSNYRQAREEYLRQPEAAYVDAFPRSRLLRALGTLLGVDRSAPDASLAALQYRALTDSLRETHPSLSAASFPELVIIDGDFPTANHVDLGDESYILVSRGLEVTSIRLARYCIAWVVPSAISYMDRPPNTRDPRAMRIALAERLHGFAHSQGDVSGLARVQVSGLRDVQASALAMTFDRFVLGHELAHVLQSKGLLAPVGSPLELEVQADVHAARALREEPELDGDTMMLETVKSFSVEDVRTVLRLTAMTSRSRMANLQELTDTDLDPANEEFIAGIDRFANCDWYAAAVAAFILILGGSVGYHGSHDPRTRASTVVSEAFGERIAAEVMEEMDRPGSALWMLRLVFADESSEAP